MNGLYECDVAASVFAGDQHWFALQNCEGVVIHLPRLRADLDKGTFEPVAFCPGYLRGLDFVGNYAIVGLSKSRENRTFSGLELDDNLTKNKVEPRCGLYVIDLETGDVVHWARIEGVVTELYDVAVLPNRRNTAAVGFRTDEIRRVVSIDPSDA